MKIKTIENLLERLDKDLIWRTKELAAIKLLVDNSDGLTLELNTRMGIVLLYAHWEGYIKNSSNCYIIYLSQFKFRYNELKENFIALSLRGNIKTCADTNKVSVHFSVVNTLINNLNYETKIPHNEVIPRIAILDSDLFFEILFTLGLNKSQFELKQHLIDRVLVKNRNEVAHGKDTPITKADFDLLFKEVTEMLELFKKEIYIAAKSQSFRKVHN
jgi:hypothetical protein